MNKIDIKSMTKEEIEEDIVSLGLPKFRASQIHRALFSRLIETWWLQHDKIILIFRIKCVDVSKI